MIADWQALTLGIVIAFFLGAASGYAVLRWRRARTERDRDRVLRAMKQAFQELNDGLHSPLARAREGTEHLQVSRRLGAEERAQVSAIADALDASLHRLTTVLQLARLEGGVAPPASEPFDLHALLADLVSSMVQHGRSRSTRIRTRIDPRLPYRLVGDPVSVRLALTALCASLPRPGGSVTVDVSSPGRRGRDIVVRFDVTHLTAGGKCDLPRQDDIRLAERVVAALGGTLESRKRNERGAILSFEAAFAVQAGAPSAVMDIASARVLLVTREDASGARLSQSLSGAEVSVVTVPSPEDAIATMGRAIRLGDSVDAVIVEAEAANDEKNRYRELCEKANSVQTPVYLASGHGTGPDTPGAPPYNGVVDVAGPPEIVAQAIHVGVSAQRARTTGALVQVEPWAWRAGSARPRRRILVVDDNVTNLLIVENILRSAGYEVDVARSGEEALTRLLGGAYRLAILDLHMPGMDGVTLLKRYRAMRPRIKIPIAFLTANTSMEATRECSDAGADAFLTKPIVVEDLLNTVETLLKDSEVYWLPGAHGRAGEEEADSATAPRLVDEEVIRELSQIYQDDVQGVGRVIETFRAEAEELLEGMARAASANDVAAFRDHAHALWASAVNVGAASLAAACRDVKTVEPMELRRDGEAIVGRLREAFRATMSAFGDRVETPAT